jgi:hypothetical protein
MITEKLDVIPLDKLCEILEKDIGEQAGEIFFVLVNNIFDNYGVSHFRFNKDNIKQFYLNEAEEFDDSKLWDKIFSKMLYYIKRGILPESFIVVCDS